MDDYSLPTNDELKNEQYIREIIGEGMLLQINKDIDNIIYSSILGYKHIYDIDNVECLKLLLVDKTIKEMFHINNYNKVSKLFLSKEYVDKIFVDNVKKIIQQICNDVKLKRQSLKLEYEFINNEMKLLWLLH